MFERMRKRRRTIGGEVAVQDGSHPHQATRVERIVTRHGTAWGGPSEASSVISARQITARRVSEWNLR